MADLNTFPCCICDDAPTCAGDRCLEETPSNRTTYMKRDVGRWVVRQPDGLLAYYDEQTGETIKKDLTLDEMVRYRSEITGVPEHDIRKDTLNQLEFLPFRFGE